MKAWFFFHFKILFLVVISNFSTSKFWTNFHKMFKISHLSFRVETCVVVVDWNIVCFSDISVYDTKETVKITGFFIYRPTKINQYQTGWCLWPSCFMDHEESPTIWRLPTEKGSPDIPRRRWKADLSSRHKEIRIFITTIHWFTHLTRWYLSYHTEINSCYNKRRLCVCVCVGRGYR